MSTTIVESSKAKSVIDPRIQAFLEPSCPEVFHSVATPTEIWKADPYDVETIHPEARAAFEKLLHRGGRIPAPPSGAVLVLNGEAGSGKTHLMRAFRTRAHSQGLGYCCYLQMTTEASNYGRYLLMHVIEALEQPYTSQGPSRTGLARLSAALLEQLTDISQNRIDEFHDGDCDVEKFVDEAADRLTAMPQFRGCDLELIRVILHLERNDPRVRNRALMWLRCEEMRTQDREWIGGAVPRIDEADPARMMQQLARLVNAIHGVPLVLLIDQLEDIANQSASTDRFLKVVDAITTFADQIPNSIVILACLEDYFQTHIQKVTKSKHDRLTRDPEPMRLVSNRTLDEIRAMTGRRLDHLYDEANVERGVSNDIFPFQEAHLAQLNGLRSRDVLDFLRRHHQRCITVGEWLEPGGTAPPPIQSLPNNLLDQLWNDFHSTFKATVPDEESQLAVIVSDATNSVNGEYGDVNHLHCGKPDQRYLEVETHAADNSVSKLLVAICNGKSGTPLLKQVEELEKRAGEISVAVVRSTDFPKTGQAMQKIASMLRREGRRVVVADADWRRMLAFEAFRKQNASRSDFGEWQKKSRPLSELDSLQKILRLHTLSTESRYVSPLRPVEKTSVDLDPAERAAKTPELSTTTELQTRLILGQSQSMASETISFEPIEFTRHAAFIGGSGSGKTTAALNLIEQMLAHGIPAVLLDRKGDLCQYADPAAWHRPLPAGKSSAARESLRSKINVAVFTPGEPNGRPLALPIVPPGFDRLAQADRERFSQYAAAALGSMIGFKTSDKDKGQLAILAKAIETMASKPGVEINASMLREVISMQDDTLMNAIGGDYPRKYFDALSERLLTLTLNNKQLLTGNERLDIDALLGTGEHAQPGRVNLSIISTKFLGDATKVDFWVSQFLVAVSRWCAKSPLPQLQAVFLFDEADRYLPATSKPASKEPMEDLLKRARSAGVGIFLATQSPGDFDYKCKENVTTWLIGRVKEPRAIEKLKPMLAAARGDVTGKLPGQGQGEFFLVRESGVTSVRSNQSFIRTEQLPEDQIANLARAICHPV